jgi:hypothetical protein
MTAPQKPRIHCPHCDQLAPAARLDWDELAEERLWGGGDDLHMGPHVWKSEPPTYYFRRVRRCSRCNELIHTAEVDESLIPELVRLRATVGLLRKEANRASKATKALQKLLD